MRPYDRRRRRTTLRVRGVAAADARRQRRLVCRKVLKAASSGSLARAFGLWRQRTADLRHVSARLIQARLRAHWSATTKWSPGSLAKQLETLEEGDEEGDSDEEGTWHCEHLCGFRGSYEAVCSHEANCKSHPKNKAVAEEQSIWYCEQMCGFSGSFDVVCSHESTCNGKTMGAGTASQRQKPVKHKEPGL